MKLRDNFPSSKEEAKIFDVEILDKSMIFKVFDSEDSLEGFKITVEKVNNFLLTNGYELINISKFIEDDCSYDSADELVSLSKHGYISALVLFITDENYSMEKDKFTNIGRDVIALLKECLEIIANKLDTDTFLKQALIDVSNLPNKPEQNIFISFKVNHQTFYISLSDSKVEFHCNSEDFYEDENGKKSDFETIEQYRFLYEIGGCTDLVGSFDWFREELLAALKNVSADEISISEDE